MKADLGYLPQTDAGNADRLVARHGEDLKFAPGLGWFVWRGDRWERDPGGELVRRARNAVAATYELGVDRDDAKLRKHARRSESHRALTAMIRLAQADARIEVRPDQLDAEPWALNTPSGIIDLHTGHLRPHDRRELHTRMTTAAYAPGLEAAVWEAFLDRVLGGDAGVIAFVQRLAGLSLIGEVLEHKLPILQGPGANGKSTFCGTLAHTLGDYADVAPLDLLMAGRRNTGAATPELAGLRGRRLVFVSESNEDGRLAVERVKAITGGDTITSRALYGNPITFRPSHTAWLQTNHRPRVSDDSEAIWRRIVLILFSVTIPEAERDAQLEHKLWEEADAILAWAVAGCISYQRLGLDPPAVVRAATQKYRGDEDSFGAWLADCTSRTTDCERSSNLHRSYSDWALQHGAGKLSAVALADRLEAAGYARRRTNIGTVWDGVRLLSSNDQGQL